jgi:membrane protease YdiL (CAAX protease family)
MPTPTDSYKRSPLQSRRKPALKGSELDSELRLTRRVERRWRLALLIAFCYILPIALRVGHGHLGAAIVAWLIYGAIIRLVILIIDRAPEGRTKRPSPTRQSRTWTVRYAVLAFLAVIVMSLGVEALKSLAGWGWPEAAKGVLIVDVLFLIALIPLYRAGRLGLADLGIRKTSRKLGVGLFLLGLSGTIVFNAVWRTIVSLPHIENALAGLPHRSTLVIALTGVTVCLSAPIVEEIFFRGFLYRSLRNRLPVLPAALIIGVIFGLGHAQYPLLERPEQAVFGVIACLLYERSGSLLPGIALHMLIDASAFELALTGTAWIVPSVFLLGGVVVLYGGPRVPRITRLLARSGPPANDTRRAGDVLIAPWERPAN